MKAQCEEYRAKIIEAAAEASEELMEKYLEGEEFIRRGNQASDSQAHD